MINRQHVSVLALSATALVGLLLNESYTDEAVIPVKGDIPTVGFGSTVREDGSSVEMGDRITPPKAVARTLAHIQADERGIRRCVFAPVSQVEYDLMVDFSYQYGIEKLCQSSMVRNTNAGRYGAACDGYVLYRWQGGRDCSLPENWGPRGCRGVWVRAIGRKEQCLKGLGKEAQS